MQQYECMQKPDNSVAENPFLSNFNQESLPPPPPVTQQETEQLPNVENSNCVQPEIQCLHESNMLSPRNSVICNQCGSDVLISATTASAAPSISYNKIENPCETNVPECSSIANSGPEKLLNFAQEPIIMHQNHMPHNQLNSIDESMPYTNYNPIIQSSYAQLKQQIQNQQKYYKQFVNEFNQGFYQNKSNGLDSTINRPMSARSKINDKLLYNETKKLPIEIEPSEAVYLFLFYKFYFLFIFII